MHILEAWMMYHNDKRIENYSNYTLTGYKIQARLLSQGLGNVQFEEITTADLKRYLAAQTHLKPSSLGHRIRFIKSLFRWAQDEGMIVGNPAAKIKEPHLGTRVPKALSEEDIELLRIGCKTAFEHALLEFLYSSGCRIGEVHKLNRDTINWERCTVIVRGKGNREREACFSVRARIWLKRYISERKDEDPALFVTVRAPRRMSIARMREILKGVADRSQVPVNVSPHRMRHSFATHLLNNRAPMEFIQSQLGHAKLDTTRIYAHQTGEHRRQEYKRYARF